jgi:uncharacterized protein (UPF0264 family)
MAELLVSVRSAEEAAAALAGGAALIDIKEPSRGSLGRPDAATIACVLQTVAGRRPVSVALGELLHTPSLPSLHGLSYAKWGLAGCGERESWRAELESAIEPWRRVTPECRWVAVAYADWRRAQAPPPEDVCAFACQRRAGAFLLDTWHKDGTTLLDWLSPTTVGELTACCRLAGVRVALAGSLRLDQLAALLPVNPDWFAVRGAVCRDGDRRQEICPERIRDWADFLSGCLIP